MLRRLEIWLQDMRQLSVPVLILVALFAIASWIDINGIYVELPLMVNVLPEGWDLPSYIVIITQVANAAPLIYTVLKKLYPDKVKEWYTVIIIISIGVVSCILLGFFWDYTTGADADGSGGTSTALFTLATFLAVVDCTSSVVFLPYMATFRQQYLNALYFGEGLSGLIPAILGLIQGLGGDPVCLNQTIVNGTTDYEIIAIYSEPNFTVNTFYFILSGLLGVSLISFITVHFHPAGKRERKFRKWNSIAEAAEKNMVGDSSDTPGMNASDEKSRDGSSNRSTTEESKGYAKQNVCFNNDNSQAENSITVELKSFHPMSDEYTDDPDARDTGAYDRSDGEAHACVDIKEPESILGIRSISTLLIVAWVNALSNGVLPSIQTYSCLPYGNTAYNLSVRLSVAANPIACFFGIFVTMKSVWGCLVLTVFGTLCSAYQLVLASMSPTPPLYDQDSGAALAIATFVVLTALFSYVKMCCAARLGERSGAEGLLWCGVVTQLGSLIGAVVTFILVNVVKVFQSKYDCT